MAVIAVFILGVIAVSTAFPTPDPVISKLDDGLRYSYLEDDSGTPHLVDTWLKISDVSDMARYNPDRSNAYHLFTRDNPRTSQPLVLNDVDRVAASNFNGRKRTIVLMHGFLGGATTEFNTVLVPAFLEADDCNVIVLDWSRGAHWGPHATEAGAAAGRFITWLNSVTGSTPNLYHIVGYSVGGHGAGIIARNVVGNVGYVTALDPAEHYNSAHIFRQSDGLYTEVIHTSSLGEPAALGHADFYPNGGRRNPGCSTSLCNHYRSYFFMAESLKTGGFTGQRCLTVADAQKGICDQPETLHLGGIEPKTGHTGIYHLTTNRRAPFSKG